MIAFPCRSSQIAGLDLILHQVFFDKGMLFLFNKKSNRALNPKLKQLFLLLAVLSFDIVIPQMAFPEILSAQTSPAKRQVQDNGQSVQDAGPISPQNFIKKHRALADAHRKKKSFAQAINEYKTALSMRPSDRHSRFWLATLYRWTHQFEKAGESYGLILKDHPEDSDAKMGLAYVYRAQRKNTETKKLLEEILVKHPHHHEANMLYARVLDGEGKIRKASDIYLEVVTNRPDDLIARSKYLSTRKRSHTTIKLDVKSSRTRILEGRGDPIAVTRMEYLSDSIGLKSGVPLSDQLTFSAQFRQKDETLTLLELDGQPRNRTIYSFDTNTLLFGTFYQPKPGWKFSGRIGSTRYKDQAGSIEDLTVGRYEIKGHYQDHNNKAEVRILRGPMLGRSTGGALDFRIFRKTEGSLKYRRKIQKRLIGTARLTLSNYSDDNRTYEISAGLKFLKYDADWRITISKTNLQGRFLVTPALNLEFIDVHTIQFDYNRKIKESWKMIAYARYRFFEDGNKEHHIVVRAVYSFQEIPWLSAGIEEEIDHFNRDAVQYSTLSIRSRTTGTLSAHMLWGPHWKTDLKAKLSTTNDEGGPFFQGHGVEAKVEYTLPFSAIFVVRGTLERNTLNDSRKKIIGYLLFIF